MHHTSSFHIVNEFVASMWYMLNLAWAKSGLGARSNQGVNSLIKPSEYFNQAPSINGVGMNVTLFFVVGYLLIKLIAYLCFKPFCL
jgi:hypothetical protein